MIRRVAMGVLVFGVLLGSGCSAFQTRPEACTVARGSITPAEGSAVTWDSEHCVTAGPSR